MKKAGLILFAGLLLSTAAFSGFYYLGTSSWRALMSEPQPELAWLKKEFKLSDEEFARISKLHEAYLPECAERCKRIAEQDQQLQALISDATNMTPQIQNLLTERAKTRADCEAEMLKHFLAVSRTMTPEQGRRYLVWVESQSCLRGQAMEERHKAENSRAAQPHM
jgi:hypothetical protein